MKYIDSSFREAEQTVGFWMQTALGAKIREVRCQAGYFTLDGSALLLPMLKQCAANGAIVRLLLGSNGGATLASHIAFLAGTLGVPRENVSLGVVSFDNALFHPKVYHFVREDGSQTAYVGSANLTGPGLSGMNVEAGVILDTSAGDNEKPLHDIVERIETWFARRSAGLSTITGHKDIDNLLEAGHLALKPVRRERDLEEEAPESSIKRREPRARLATIFDLPAVHHEEEAEPASAREREPAPRAARRSRIELVRLAGNTEASFHYPQGTHLGHILTILFHFAGNREGTAFDDKFIRLKGGLGTGRVAGYRRQIKYKLLAAIELGLITDLRLAENVTAYTPELTEAGRVLWGLLRPFVPVADLILGADENGDYSASMPQQPAYYNHLLARAQAESADVQDLYRSVFLNMPAVKHMLKFLYHQERTRVVMKARIYENFFQSAPVQGFCDAVGIEPATQEGARHRCPFLLNILESCQIVEQSQFDVTVRRLAVAADLMIPEGGNPAEGERLLRGLMGDWGNSPSALPQADQDALRELFGDSFLTDRYHLNELIEIPS